ncbi:MAG: 6-phosphogluconolactonase [Abditibacteriaceae bacterium]
MENQTFLIKPSASQLITEVANRLVEYANQCVAEREQFTIALSGGSTPKALYELLAVEPWRLQMPWKNTIILFGDERAVPRNDPRSNYQMTEQTLLSKVGIPPENIWRLRGEAENLDEAAQEYETRLHDLDDVIDLTLLGMGPDGHTASLFPLSPVLTEMQRLCVSTPEARLDPQVRRLTLTYPAINASRQVWVLVTGESKAERLQQVLEGEHEPHQLPIQGVHPLGGELVWMLDSAAAARLEKA